jgi:translocation and assembly module TamB
LAGTADPEILLLRTLEEESGVRLSRDNRALARTTIDIKVEAPRAIQVLGRGVESSWRGDGSIGGTLSKPVVTGALTATVGTLSFLGQPFSLTSGRIEFAGDDKVDPSLDVVVSRTRDGLTAVLRIAGRVSAPTISISSTPPYPSDEILSRILFGKNMSQLGPLEAAQIAATTTNMLGSGPGLMGVLRRGLAVDYIGVGGQSGEAIAVRKNIGRNLAIGLEQEMSGSERLFIVEWQLSRQISVRSTSDGQSGADIGLAWRKDY